MHSMKPQSEDGHRSILTHDTRTHAQADIKHIFTPHTNTHTYTQTHTQTTTTCTQKSQICGQHGSMLQVTRVCHNVKIFCGYTMVTSRVHNKELLWTLE